MVGNQGINLGEMENCDLVNSGVIQKSGYEGCVTCLELQYKLAEANERFARLESEVGKKNCVNQNDADENDQLTQLMIENKVLECEKNEFEREVGVWKAKCKALETEVMELEKRLSAGITKTSGAAEPSVLRAEIENKANSKDDASGTPRLGTPYNHHKSAKGIKGVAKCLDFTNEGNLHKNVSPSTPVSMPPVGPVIISDSDGDEDLNTQHLRKNELTSKDRYTEAFEQESDEEEQPLAKRRKVRKRPANMHYSDSESDSEDHIPLSQIMSKKETVNTSCCMGDQKERTPRTRLVRLADCVNKGVSGKCPYKNTRSKNKSSSPEMNENVSDDEMEEDHDDSISESESLEKFIVNDSDVSENDGTSDGDNSADSENSTETSTEFANVLSVLRRERKDKTKWGCGADMLADFGKFPELCMKAVCALYRQQTSDEKSCKSTIHRNRRGFSTVHADRGSELAEFLMDGESDVNKSVAELEEFDPNGVERCRHYAMTYSNQLFEIYKNKEDPFFHPLILG